jgi:Fur family ferric uptake transcriptional regulator
MNGSTRTAPEVSHSDQLRQAGLRVTSPRLATLAVLAERQHAETDDIAAAVRERLGSVSTQAVYGVLHALTEAGLVRRLDTGSRDAARYEIHRHDNHHHLLCRVCGRVEDVPCVKGKAPCLEPEDDLGFSIEIAEVLFRGVCAECRTAETAPTAATA